MSIVTIKSLQQLIKSIQTFHISYISSCISMPTLFRSDRSVCRSDWYWRISDWPTYRSDCHLGLNLFITSLLLIKMLKAFNKSTILRLNVCLKLHSSSQCKIQVLLRYLLPCMQICTNMYTIISINTNKYNTRIQLHKHWCRSTWKNKGMLISLVNK